MLTAAEKLAETDAMSGKKIIETTIGKIWATHYDDGDVALWTPPGSQQSDAVADIVRGRAAWKPKFRSWFVPEVHAEQVLAELETL